MREKFFFHFFFNFLVGFSEAGYWYFEKRDESGGDEIDPMRIFREYYSLGDDSKFSKYLFWHVNRKKDKLIKKNLGKDYFSRVCKNLAKWLGKPNWQCFRCLF